MISKFWKHLRVVDGVVESVVDGVVEAASVSRNKRARTGAHALWMASLRVVSRASLTFDDISPP